MGAAHGGGTLDGCGQGDGAEGEGPGQGKHEQPGDAPQAAQAGSGGLVGGGWGDERRDDAKVRARAAMRRSS